MKLILSGNLATIGHKASRTSLSLLLINATMLSAVPIGTLPALAANHKIATSIHRSGKEPKPNKATEGNNGTLLAFAAGKRVGECPLQKTEVVSQISGYVSRVKVTQVFKNPYKEKIEATYTFPLSDSGAVDAMTMKVGNRTIKGTIKKREEARQIYEAAREQGHVAALLDQERTNIFTQSVANIEPGETVTVTLQYVELLKYDAGTFTFTFPTVVGPRFTPGSATGHEGTGTATDTDIVPDASKLTPPVTPEGTRAGHDISIKVIIDSGVPIQKLESKLHEVNIENEGSNGAVVSLKDKQTIPNRDFVLSWDVAAAQLRSGYLTHRDPADKTGFFTLMLLPPKRVTVENVAPKEMIFLIDCSGSQSGAPLQKAKQTLSYIVDHMNPNDTFQIIAFNDRAQTLFQTPQKVDASLKLKAQKFIRQLRATGGTWMAPAVEKACAIPADQHRLRIVTFMTDGYIDNEAQVCALIHKHRATSRWFSFGTGDSVNRELIDGIAQEGGGEAEYVLLNSSAGAAGKKFYDRISSPVLTDVAINFGKLDVKEVFPKDVNDVWAERPLYIKGRYVKAGSGTVTLTGYAGGKPYKQTLQVNLPESNSKNAVLASIWARAKVDRLMAEDYLGVQLNKINLELRDEIVQTALQYHIMTNYTSFVAVEEKIVTKGGAATKVTVPVEMPEGVSREGVFGSAADKTISEQEVSFGRSYIAVLPPPPLPGAAAGGAADASPPSRYLSGKKSAGGRAYASIPKPEDERPIIHDFREAPTASPAPEKSASPEEAKSARVDSKLQALIAALKSRKPLPFMAGLDTSAHTVDVEIKLTDGDQTALERLQKCKLLQRFSWSKGRLIGTVKLVDLEQLSRCEFIQLLTAL